MTSSLPRSYEAQVKDVAPHSPQLYPPAARSSADGVSAFHNGWRGRFNVRFFQAFDSYIAHIARAHKTLAFGDLSAGTIVEIGAGIGANFDFVPEGSQLSVLEPNLAMHPCLRERAAARGIPLVIHAQGAERLPFADASVDDVLCSLVLCTVSDQRAVLREVLRVLRPGGRLRFVEHVAAPFWSPRRWLQHALRKPWRWIFEGCDLCCETPRAIAGAGFCKVALTHRRWQHSLFVPVNCAVYGIAFK